MELKLGKIISAEFGQGGYQDAMIGITFNMGGDSWGVGDFWGYWNTEISSSTQWGEQDRRDHLGKTVMRISQLLKDSKKQSISQLAGVPVEVTFEGQVMKSWRALKEVL